MRTLHSTIEHFGVQVDEHHDLDSLVPISDGLQRQGDLIVIPAAMAGRTITPAATPVPTEGVPVVRGEAGGNTHLLLADGTVTCDVRTASATDLRLATLTVPDGSTAYLCHPEHAYQGIAPGTYELRRQREQADELRVVSD